LVVSDDVGIKDALTQRVPRGGELRTLEPFTCDRVEPNADNDIEPVVTLAMEKGEAVGGLLGEEAEGLEHCHRGRRNSGTEEAAEGLQFVAFDVDLGEAGTGEAVLGREIGESSHGDADPARGAELFGEGNGCPLRLKGADGARRADHQVGFAGGVGGGAAGEMHVAGGDAGFVPAGEAVGHVVLRFDGQHAVAEAGERFGEVAAVRADVQRGLAVGRERFEHGAEVRDLQRRGQQIGRGYRRGDGRGGRRGNLRNRRSHVPLR
jgi:hypothetical protein